MGHDVALSKQRQFEALRTVLGMVEEQHALPLVECAAAVGMTGAQLHEALRAVLLVDFYDADGRLVTESSAFLLTDDGVLSMTERHWLRDLDATPPTPESALRLLISGVTMQAITTVPTPDLDNAVRKLRGIVAAELHLDVVVPPALAIVREAIHARRSLHVRYLSADRDGPTDRDLLPHRAWSKWGHWYLTARDATESQPKHFRVDRMLDVRVEVDPFDPPDDVSVPEWFDLSEHDRTVRVQMRAAALESLPAPHRLGAATDLGDGRVELDVTVVGDRRLEQLLLCLEPDDEVVAPEEYADLRRIHAARLLAQYDQPAGSDGR